MRRLPKVGKTQKDDREGEAVSTLDVRFLTMITSLQSWVFNKNEALCENQCGTRNEAGSVQSDF